MTRRGVALFATLLALLCVGALIVAAAFGSAQAFSVSTAARDETRALAAADRGAWTGYMSVGAADSAISLGASRQLQVAIPHVDTVDVSITRLAGGVFAVIAEASAGSAHRRVALFVITTVDSAGTFVSTLLPDHAWAELP